MSKLIIQECDKLLDELKSLRPIEKKHLAEIRSYWKISFTYTSNALEGNTLAETETKVILEDGLTIGGKSMLEHFEVVGHADAFAALCSALDQGQTITEPLTLQLHKLFYHRIDSPLAGTYRDRNVLITGTTFLPPPFAEVPARMNYLFSTFQNTAAHPIEVAALFHNDFVNIHPFVDGNGRTVRLLVNLLLMKAGFPVVAIPPIFRARYIAACEASNRSYLAPMVDLFAEITQQSLRDYLRLLRSLN